MKPTKLAKISIINQTQDQLFFGLFRWAVRVAVYPISFCFVEKPNNLLGTDVLRSLGGRTVVGLRSPSDSCTSCSALMNTQLPFQEGCLMSAYLSTYSVLPTPKTKQNLLNTLLSLPQQLFTRQFYNVFLQVSRCHLTHFCSFRCRNELSPCSSVG